MNGKTLDIILASGGAVAIIFTYGGSLSFLDLLLIVAAATTLRVLFPPRTMK